MDCAGCHASAVRTFLESAHGRALAQGSPAGGSCALCHGQGHEAVKSIHPDSAVFKFNVPATCGQCHVEVMEAYEKSVHGQALRRGVREAPACTDCHGEHTIRAVKDKASSVWSGAVTKTCSGCHASDKIIAKFGLPADRLSTYLDSYHGLAGRGGDLEVANCASCHGWHSVLPSSHPDSSVHPGHLGQTCGKCHPGAQWKLAGAKIHRSEAEESHAAVKWVRWIYRVLIPLLVGLMLLHNLADYARKTFFSGGAPAAGSGVLRMNRNERIQHALLAAAFFTLAYSGFALKFPEDWWARPFQAGGGEWLRKGVHRWTALAFVGVSIWHAATMLLTRRGRFILSHRLRPRLLDLRDGAQLTLYNLGLAKGRPNLRYPSYIEKSEYWALIWGSLLMVLTGAFLVFNRITIYRFPLWMSDLATVIHLYEAVLACLSILVWHFYWTIFDPDVYPMNKAWLTGRLTRR